MKKDMEHKKGAVEIAFQRSRFYELLSYTFWCPSEEFVQFIKDGGFENQLDETLRMYPLSGKIDISHLLKVKKDLMDISFEEVRRYYSERLDTPKLKLLYECRYHEPFSSYEEMADISGFYRAFGFTFEDERPDHISYELDFMRLLTLKESRAYFDDNKDGWSICRDAERSFLEAHLGRWTHLLMEITEAMPFYNPMALLLHSWIMAECDYMGVRPEPLKYPVDRIKEIEPEIFNHCIKEVGI